MFYFMLLFLLLILFCIVRNIFKLGFRKYIMNALIGLDQFINAICFGGNPDETISSRCCRGYKKRWYWTLLGKLLNLIQENHIQSALESEKQNKHSFDRSN